MKRLVTKLIAWARGIKRDVLALWIAARDKRTPLAAKLVAGTVAAYALSPIDLIPDFIPVLGYLDDLIIVPLGIAVAVRLIPAPLMTDFRRLAERRATRPRSFVAAAAIVALWVARATVALVGLVAILALKPGRLLWGLKVLAGLLVAASFAWTGHGATTVGPGGLLHLGADIVHTIAAALWLGALASLTILLLRRTSPDDHALHRALHGFAGLGMGSAGLRAELPTLTGPNIDLTVGHSPFTVGGRTGHAVTINGVLPAPLLRLREGQNARLAVTNGLDEDTSIHWHGLLLPFQMDGVPGISFPGIKARETFVYEFPIKQSGTFWYHSHSGLQEAMGHYGPIVIDPAGADPVAYDREHVLVLSDWSFMHPHEILAKLKKSPGYFNQQRTTLAGLMDGSDRMSLEERRMWGQMRMDPRDILDVNGSTYTYLINGHGPEENWTGLFRPGERVRLRVINASAMSIFNVRIPGLPMTVVQADGENVRPVETDEFQISVAETYDVIVQPTEDRAYTIVSEAIDRSGMGRATLAPRMGMTAEVPPLREVPNLTMRDMGMGGMDHGSMGDMSGMDHGAMAGMDHGAPGQDAAPAGEMAGMSMAGMNMRDPENAPPDMAVGVGVDAIAMDPANRLGERPIGLTDVDHRVLVYTDLVSLQPNKDQRPPSRTMEIHLTGNMERFMWGFDGRKFSELVEPIRFERNERVRVTLVNDTMMAHPIHLHGHFFELVTGGPAGHQPLKHTVNVAAGGKVTFDLTADAPGDWAFHCHMLMHMHAGMFNVVTVRPMDGAAS